MSSTTELSPQTETPSHWYTGVTRYQWLVLLIASLGWIFDAFEGQVFLVSMDEAMPALAPQVAKSAHDLYNNLGFAAFLVGGAIGGVGFGVLSDRIGRVRTMSFTILFYSAFTCLSAFSQAWWHLVLLRFFVALGVGGEWAVASAMVAEVFPARARASASAIFHGSSILAVFAAAAVGAFIVGNPALGWRWAFGVGVLPALLTVWVYLSLREPEQWVQARARASADHSQQTGRLLDLFKPGLLRSTLVGLALAAVGLATFWGVYARGQSFMRELHERELLGASAREFTPDQRRAVLDPYKVELKHREMLALLLISTGGAAGFLGFAPTANRFGRRGAFGVYCLGGVATSLLLFKVLPHGPAWLLWSSLPAFGFFGTGMHAGYAVYFPELFPTRLRGTGGGVCFNGGRLVAAPILILKGFMGEWNVSMEDSCAILALLFLLGVVVLWFAPETKGRELPT